MAGESGKTQPPPFFKSLTFLPQKQRRPSVCLVYRYRRGHTIATSRTYSSSSGNEALRPSTLTAPTNSSSSSQSSSAVSRPAGWGTSGSGARALPSHQSGWGFSAASPAVSDLDGLLPHEREAKERAVRLKQSAEAQLKRAEEARLKQSAKQVGRASRLAPMPPVRPDQLTRGLPPWPPPRNSSTSVPLKGGRIEIDPLTPSLVRPPPSPPSASVLGDAKGLDPVSRKRPERPSEKLPSRPPQTSTLSSVAGRVVDAASPSQRSSWASGPVFGKSTPASFGLLPHELGAKERAERVDGSHTQHMGGSVGDQSPAIRSVPNSTGPSPSWESLRSADRSRPDRWAGREKIHNLLEEQGLHRKKKPDMAHIQNLLLERSKTLAERDTFSHIKDWASRSRRSASNDDLASKSRSTPISDPDLQFPPLPQPFTVPPAGDDVWEKLEASLHTKRPPRATKNDSREGPNSIATNPLADDVASKIQRMAYRPTDVKGAVKDASDAWDWVDDRNTAQKHGTEHSLKRRDHIVKEYEGAQDGEFWHDRRKLRRLGSEEPFAWDTREKGDVKTHTRSQRGRTKVQMNGKRFERKQDVGDREDDFDIESYQERRRRREERKREKQRAKQEALADAGPIPILLPEFISVANLGAALNLKQDIFLGQLEELGFENITKDSVLTGETAALVAQEYGYEPTVDIGEEEDLKPRPPPEDPSSLPHRPPVVTIMGHVDHGKTTILDYLRKSSIVSQEHGGITQHIGAFSVELSTGKQITFLDTPGHAAFLTMRQRGANVTDMVILVVAADDSVKPQTVEALKHARAAKVPIIVAINKVDKESANVERVKSDLAAHGVEIEDYGGDVQVVCVSGKTGVGMNDLEENIILLSEMLDIRAEKDGMAEGWVLESSVKPSGRVATVLVKRGTLRPGDHIVAGRVAAKIRSLRNEAGVEVSEAPPGTAIEVLGWKEYPEAGDQVLQAPDEDKAKRAAHYRQELKDREEAATLQAQQEDQRREKAAAAEQEAMEGDEALEKATEGGPRVVNFTVKCDVHGSVEAVCAAVLEIGNNEVQPRVLQSATGQITESDVEHAAISGSLILNFSNPIPGHIKRMADDAGVKILDHNVIYHLIEEVRDTLSEYLAPTISTRVVAEAEVLQVFSINTKGRMYKSIAGCRVRNGLVTRNAKVRVNRQKATIFEGMNAWLSNLDVEKLGTNVVGDRKHRDTQARQERYYGGEEGIRVWYLIRLRLDRFPGG